MFESAGLDAFPMPAHSVTLDAFAGLAVLDHASDVGRIGFRHHAEPLGFAVCHVDIDGAVPATFDD